MTDATRDALERRLRDLRARTTIRSWEYRQRHRSKGVWYRLRRVLAEAEHAFVVSPEEARELLSEGFEPERVGGELHPPKTIVIVPEERAGRLTSRREIPLRLGPELLAARDLVLVPFPER